MGNKKSGANRFFYLSVVSECVRVIFFHNRIIIDKVLTKYSA